MMRVAFTLRNENTQEGNTWFSDAHTGEAENQLHITRDLWVALGRPNFVRITIDPYHNDPDEREF